MKTSLIEWFNEAKMTKTSSIHSLAINISHLIFESAERVYGSSTPEKDVMSSEDLEKIFYETISSHILFLSSNHNPERLILVLDGVPLRAQLPRLRKQYHERAVWPLLDPNILIDGSDAIKKIVIHLQSFIEEKRALLPSTIIFSSHEERGLAEEKIFFYIEKSSIIFSSFQVSLLLHALNSAETIYLAINDKDFLSINSAKEIIQHKLEIPQSIFSFMAALLLIDNNFFPVTLGFRDIIKAINEDIVTPTADRILWRSYLMFLSRIKESSSNNRNRTIDNMDERIHNYLEVLNFAYYFYRSGDIRSEEKEMSIQYPYEESPSLIDIIRIGKGQITKIVKEETWKQWNDPLNELEYLKETLPVHSIRHIMGLESIDIYIKPNFIFQREKTEERNRTVSQWSSYLF